MMGNALTFALDVTLPIFLLVVVGIVLKRVNWIDDQFSESGSKLVFNLTLPALLFLGIYNADFNDANIAKLLIYATLATTLIYVFLEWSASRWINRVAERGVFVQGAFRSNMGIVGLAYCVNAYGVGILKEASLYLAVITLLFNVLSVMTLSRHKVKSQSRGVMGFFKQVAFNPLIVAIALGFVIKGLNLEIPSYVNTTLDYVASITLPLALLCVGATIRWHEFSKSATLYWTVTAKLVMVPFVITLGALLIGLPDKQVGVVFLMSSAPTAAASYPMVRAISGDYHLAAAIIAATTMASIVATSAGIFVLGTFGIF